jgi:flagellar basal body-associated protein FliL
MLHISVVGINNDSNKKLIMILVVVAVVAVAAAIATAAHMGEMSNHKILVRKPEGKRPLGRPRHR